MFAHAPRVAVDEAASLDASGSATAIGERFSGETIQRLMGGLTESSTAFLVALPNPSRLALKPTEVLRAALEEVLMEVCSIDVLDFGSNTFAVVLAPEGQRPIDPLSVSLVLESFRRRINEALGLGDEGTGVEGESAAILPIARVASVDTMQGNLTALNELLETMLNKRLRVQFQPIVQFASAEVFGYEALIRAPQTGLLKKPGMLFQAAEKARLLSWLDIACQDACLERAQSAGLKAHLFTNMEPEGLSNLHLAERTLAERCAAYGISPGRVVLEITERQAIDDFPRLKQFISELRAQGFKIALDDAGAGYNSLHAIAEIRPHFVKIDRSLVRSIDTNGARRALLSTLTRFSSQIGAAVIAEGCETRDELATVIDLGVPYGQGYILGKPQDGFRNIRGEMREFIPNRLEQYRRRLIGRSYAVERMARTGATFPPETAARALLEKFKKNPDMESAVVVADELAEGLIMRERFLQAASTTSAEDLDLRTVADYMDGQPTTVEASSPLEAVVLQTTYRPATRFHDDLIVTREGKYAGIIPVRALLEAVVRVQVNGARYVNGVTEMPGLAVIEQAANEVLQAGKDAALVHVEIGYFRPYNHHFGMLRGDDILRETAQLLRSVLADRGGDAGRAAHVGGNDFLLLLGPDDAKSACEALAREFEAISQAAYPIDDARRGCLETVDPAGQARRVPLLCLRITGALSTVTPFATFAQGYRHITRARATASPAKASTVTFLT